MKTSNTSSAVSTKQATRADQIAKRVLKLVERQRPTDMCSTTSRKSSKSSNAIAPSKQCDQKRRKLRESSNKHLVDIADEYTVDKSNYINTHISHGIKSSQEKNNVNTNLISRS